MCDFISWIDVVDKNGEKHCLFLTDQDIFSSYGRKTLKGTMDNDILGHGAIRAYYNIENIDSQYRRCYQKEDKEFWKGIVPSQIAKFLKSPETLLKTWGKMLEMTLQTDDAAFILTHAPKRWIRSRLGDLCVKTIAKLRLSQNRRFFLRVFFRPRQLFRFVGQ